MAVALADCVAFLNKRGLSVEIVEDANAVHDLIRALGKEYLTPIGSPEFNDLTHGNSIWLVSKRQDGPCMIGAARLDELGGEPLAAFWKRQFLRLYGEGGEVTVNFSGDVHNKGRYAYFGDLYVAPGGRGDARNVRAFTAIGHLVVSMRWDPDLTYAFVRDKDVMRGAAARYGFVDLYPNPVLWHNPPHPRSSAEWLATISREKVSDMIARVTQAIKDA